MKNFKQIVATAIHQIIISKIVRVIIISKKLTQLIYACQEHRYTIVWRGGHKQ